MKNCGEEHLLNHLGLVLYEYPEVRGLLVGSDPS